MLFFALVQPCAVLRMLTLGTVFVIIVTMQPPFGKEFASLLIRSALISIYFSIKHMACKKVSHQYVIFNMQQETFVDVAPFFLSLMGGA